MNVSTIPTRTGRISAILLITWFGLSTMAGADQAFAMPSSSAVSGKSAGRETWLNASPEVRTRLGEQIGEAGGRQLAERMGLKALFDGSAGKTNPQGFDQVYRASDGTVHVFECKANSSVIGKPTYTGGYAQGTPEHAVKASERLLASVSASEAQRSAARAVVEAAAEGRLQTHLVRTRHLLGEVTGTVVEQHLNCTDEAMRLARALRASFPELAPAKVGDSLAEAGGVMVKYCVPGKIRKIPGLAGPTIVIGLAADSYQRYEDAQAVEAAYESGAITREECAEAHARTAGEMAGGWAGAAAGATAGAIAGASLGAWGGPIGSAIGAFTGGAIGGVGGYLAGESAGGYLAESACQTWEAPATEETPPAP